VARSSFESLPALAGFENPMKNNPPAELVNKILDYICRNALTRAGERGYNTAGKPVAQVP
jgi:hypothetical protein